MGKFGYADEVKKAVDEFKASTADFIKEFSINAVDPTKDFVQDFEVNVVDPQKDFVEDFTTSSPKTDIERLAEALIEATNKLGDRLVNASEQSDEIAREANEIAHGANKRAVCSWLVSIVCVVISSGSLIGIISFWMSLPKQ